MISETFKILIMVVLLFESLLLYTSNILKLKKEDEEDEERKNSRVSQERQKTLDRLRTFKQVCAPPLTYTSQDFFCSAAISFSLCLHSEIPGSGDSEIHSSTHVSQQETGAWKEL